MFKYFINQMSMEHNKHLPYFAFNFLTEYTHDDLAIPKNLDIKLSEMLQEFSANGLLNNTLLIVFSDHGSRLTYFSFKTDLGKMEKYLPFLSIHLPDGLQNSTFQKNIAQNRNKLVTFFDLYQTLRQFSWINEDRENRRNKSTDQFRINDPYVRQHRGISLFEEVPMNRSCKAAMIPNKQCVCYESAVIDNDQFLLETNNTFLNATQMIADYVNNLARDVRKKCATFVMEKLESVKKFVIYDIIYFKFVVIMQPGDAWFEVNVKTKANDSLQVYGEVNRLSRYYKQSWCVTNSQLRNFCYCTNTIE
jgi:hypothetical protein